MKFSKIACDSMKSQFLSLRMRESIFLKPLELRVPSLDVCNINYNFLINIFFCMHTFTASKKIYNLRCSQCDKHVYCAQNKLLN